MLCYSIASEENACIFRSCKLSISYYNTYLHGNQPHTSLILGQSNLESSPLAVDLPPQSPVLKSSNPVSLFSYFVLCISVINPPSHW